MRWFAAAAALMLGLVGPGHAQVLDPDNRLLCWTCYGHSDHFETGAAIDWAARAPFVASDWRHSPVKRVALVGVLAVGYEGLDYAICRRYNTCGRPDRGFGVIDVAYTMAGAAASELITAGVKWLLR